MVPMIRLKVDEGSSALHVLADAVHCTSAEAEEQISRLEAFTSFAGEGKTALGLDVSSSLGLDFVPCPLPEPGYRQTA